MARIDVLPSIEIIRGFKGILDFYLWRGLPCVRAWPHYRPARQTLASRNAALLFGAVIKAYSLTYGLVLEQLKIEATGIPRTGRDITVSGIYGNLHEASMSDFLTLLTECRDSLSALTALLNALHDVGLDELDVHVHASALPDGAATAAHQGTQNANLILIAQLQDALESKALDRLLVRGMDQHFTFKGVLSVRETSVISGANGTADSTPVPAGEIWAVTNIDARDITTATTRHDYFLTHDAVSEDFWHQTAALPADDSSHYHHYLWMDPNDVIRIKFTGGLVADSCRIRLTGYRMTLET